MIYSVGKIYKQGKSNPYKLNKLSFDFLLYVRSDFYSSDERNAIKLDKRHPARAPLRKPLKKVAATAASGSKLRWQAYIQLDVCC